MNGFLLPGIQMVQESEDLQRKHKYQRHRTSFHYQPAKNWMNGEHPNRNCFVIPQYLSQLNKNDKLILTIQFQQMVQSQIFHQILIFLQKEKILEKKKSENFNISEKIMISGELAQVLWQYLSLRSLSTFFFPEISQLRTLKSGAK